MIQPINNTQSISFEQMKQNKVSFGHISCREVFKKGKYKELPISQSQETIILNEILDFVKKGALKHKDSFLTDENKRKFPYKSEELTLILNHHPADTFMRNNSELEYWKNRICYILKLTSPENRILYAALDNALVESFKDATLSGGPNDNCHIIQFVKK